jgi:hypothetical protein
MSTEGARYERRLWTCIADNDYDLKCSMRERNSKLTLSGETVEKVSKAKFDVL